MRKLAALFFLLALVLGCSTSLVRPRVEQGIRSALPEYIGPAAEYRVRAEGSASQMVNGRIAKLHIEGEDVQVLPELTLSRLEVEMEDVRYKPQTRKLTSVAYSTFAAIVSETSVNLYIREQRKGNSDLRVSLETDEVYVEFVPKIAGIEVPVKILGSLEIIDRDKVDFRADKASVAKLPLPAYVVNRVLDRVNPVLDLSGMKYPLRLHSVRVRKKSVSIEGELRFQSSGDGRT